MNNHCWKEITYEEVRAYRLELKPSARRLSIISALMDDYNLFYLCIRCNSIKDRDQWIWVRPCNDVLADDVMKS